MTDNADSTRTTGGSDRGGFLPQPGRIVRGCNPYSCKHRRNATLEEVMAVLNAADRPLSTSKIIIEVGRARGCNYPRLNMRRKYVMTVLGDLSRAGEVIWASGDADKYREVFGAVPAFGGPDHDLSYDTYWMLTAKLAAFRASTDAATEEANDALEALGLPRAAHADVPCVALRLAPAQMQALLAAATRATGGAPLIPAQPTGEQTGEPSRVRP
jgi:hypothetical protein